MDFDVVWFPGSILEAAGVSGLDRYDPPNARQREAIETEFGTAHRRKRIYWAEDGDCDVDRLEMKGSEKRGRKSIIGPREDDEVSDVDQIIEKNTSVNGTAPDTS